MMLPLTWFRPWMAWAAAVAALGVLLGGQTLRLSNERAAHANTREQHATELATRERAARQAVNDARTEEQRRTREVQEIADEAQKQLDVARDDADAARSAGERLRNRVAELTAALGRAAGKDPAVADASAPAEKTADLLADVQRRLDEATDGIAGFADKAHAAGAACERGYDALTPAPRSGLGLKR